jgi:hypothetical protein
MGYSAGTLSQIRVRQHTTFMEDYLSGGISTDYVVKPMKAFITDYYTSNILKGVSGPSWVRHTYYSEGGPFSSIISCLCAFGLFFLFWCAL